MKARISAKQYFENLAASQQRQQRLRRAAADLAKQKEQQPSPSAVPIAHMTPPPPELIPAEAHASLPSDQVPLAREPESPDSRAAAPFDPTSTHPRRQRSRGRPSDFSEDLADAIFDAIRYYGHTDTAAAAKFGVAASTVSRWKRENEWFATDLEAARAEYKERILAEIRNAKKRDGSPDWRAYAWILERTFPDEFGRRTRKPPEPERKPTVDEYLDITPEEVLSPEKIERLRQAHEELVNDPESWEHKQILTRAQERFEEMKAAYIAQNRGPSETIA